MPITIKHFHYHAAPGSERTLDAIVDALATLTAQGTAIMSHLDSLQAEVARNTKVDESAIALINGLAAKIQELINDPVALQGLVDSMKSSSDALAAAVAANTPA